jgi:hypothetical protein
MAIVATLVLLSAPSRNSAPKLGNVFASCLGLLGSPDHLAGLSPTRTCGTHCLAGRGGQAKAERHEDASDISKYTGQCSSTTASERIESAFFFFLFEIGHTPADQPLV